MNSPEGPIAPPGPRTDGVASTGAGAPAGEDRRLLSSLMEIVAATAATEDLDGVMETCARALGRLFPVDGAALGLVDDDQMIVREILRDGQPVRRDPDRLPGDGSHHLSWVVRRERPLWRNDAATELRFAESLPGHGRGSDMTIPLRARGAVLGAFRVSCRRRHAFELEDFELLQRCADLLAVAVDTQRLLLHTRRLAETDGVTGLYNHRYFITALRQELDRARRLDRPLTVLMADIDDFKRFNDTYGHQTGDEVLRHVAQTVARALRRSDVVCRYGGEEFVAVLQDADRAAAEPVAEKVRVEVEKNRLQPTAVPRPLHVTVSLGFACFPSDARTPAELIAAADAGLYDAKKSGKNRVRHRSRSGAPER